MRSRDPPSTLGAEVPWRLQPQARPPPEVQPGRQRSPAAPARPPLHPERGARLSDPGSPLSGVPGAPGASPASGLPAPATLRTRTPRPRVAAAPAKGALTSPRAPESARAPHLRPRPARGAPAKGSLYRPPGSPFNPGSKASRPRPRGGQAREPPPQSGQAQATRPPASRAADRRGGSGPRNCVPRRRRTRLPSTRRAMPSVRAAARPAAASAPPRRAPAALVPPSAPRQARGAAEGRPEGARQAVAAAHWPLQASLIRVANGRRPGRGYGAGGIFLTGAGRPAEGGVCRGRPAPSLLRRGPSDRHPSRAFGTVSFAPGIWFFLFLGPLFSLPPALPPTSPFPGLMHPWPPHPLPLCLRGGYLPSGLRCI